MVTSTGVSSSPRNAPCCSNHAAIANAHSASSLGPFGHSALGKSSSCYSCALWADLSLWCGPRFHLERLSFWLKRLPPAVVPARKTFVAALFGCGCFSLGRAGCIGLPVRYACVGAGQAMLGQQSPICTFSFSYLNSLRESLSLPQTIRAP